MNHIIILQTIIYLSNFITYYIYLFYLLQTMIYLNYYIIFYIIFIELYY